jgi:hypothetical protein
MSRTRPPRFVGLCSSFTEVATSLTDLFSAVAALTDPQAHVSLPDADANVLAMAPAAVMLTRLVDDGIGHARPRRAELVRELATACADAGAEWRGTVSPGRVTDLMAAAADVVGTLRAEFGQAERWSCAVQVAEMARRCIATAQTHPPYGNIPDLTRVHRAAATIEQLAALDPPTTAESGLLSRRIPVAGLPAGLGGSEIAAEAAAWLLDRLRRPGSQRLDVRGATAIVYAAELASRTITTLSQAAVIGEPRTDLEARAVEASASAWAQVRSALASFDDGSRRKREPLSGVNLWAARLGEGMCQSLQTPSELHGTVRPGSDDFRQIWIVAICLPLLASELVKTSSRWSAHKQLVVDPSRHSPSRPDRVDAVLVRSLVTADAGDLSGLVCDLRRAEALGSTVARLIARSTLDVVAVPRHALPRGGLKRREAFRQGGTHFDGAPGPDVSDTLSTP